MIPGRQYTVDDFLRMAWARKWLILVSFVVASTATIAVASRLPDQYRAETLILTVPQRVPQEYVRATVTAQIRDRLPSISQQILSRTALERIIRDFDLYPDIRKTTPMEVVVDQMRSDIEVQIVDGSESCRVRYEGKSPLLGMKVTERIAGLFIEENLRDRELLARATSAFLESQLEAARARLVEQEKRLEAYRLRYGAELPTQLQSNMQAIQNTQLQIQALNDGLNRDRDRRLLVARQLADLESEQFLAEPGSAVAGSIAQAPSTSTQLEVALAELNALELRLTPEHPDLLRSRHLVADLEDKLQKEAAPIPNAEVRPKPLTATELVRRNRVKELKAEIESLDRQIATRVAQQAELRTTLEAYQKRVEAVPSRESELASLTRDYDTLQSLYRSLLTKKEDSKVAENLERRQVGEQFKILDSPRRPEKPSRPNRALIDLGGAAAGLVLGIVIAALLELRDKSLKQEADVLAALAVPVIAVIPTIMSRTERRRARWRAAAVSVALATVFGMCATIGWLTFRI